MSKRALIGWLLAGAFSASVSCGGSGGSGNVPQGYGLACTSDKECTGFSLLCSPEEDKCVQCLGVDDCKRTESCMSGLCQPPQPREDSRDCSADLVCNETVGVCVECLENPDCGTGQKCASQHCVSQATCEFSSDCEDGLVCDADAGLCVTCRNDNDCPASRVCEDDECVVPGASGTGGDGGTAGTPNTAGSQNGGTPSGGTPNNGGSAGNGGGGGTLPDPCDCTLGEVCTPDQRCVVPSLLDDLFDCDDAILEIEGRSGLWAGDADVDINFMQGFGNPGSAWADHTCAAWATCGVPLGAIYTEFAFIGFMLNEGLAYSLASYTGLQIVLESDNYVQVVLKTTGGGYFQYTLTPLSGSNSRSAPFASMLAMDNSLEAVLDLSTVYEVQFSPTTPTDCGYAIHRVELYGAF